jgi:peptidoglycan hydrolase-like protein with peptidoglycan-binding domain
MARTGISQIDGLLETQLAETLTADNCTAQTVAFLQDLLIGHECAGIPGPLGAARGRFGPRTTEGIREFQRKRDLPATGAVDLATLRAFVEPGWPRPLACCGYVALVMDVPFTGIVRLVSLTSQFEGAGRFAAINRNTDRAGLSFGLIQWAQKPGRLNELLRAFQSREQALFVQVLGGGDAAVAQGLIAHTAKTRGGTDANGTTTDPRFDLVDDLWVERFTQAGKRLELQRVQLDVAAADFEKSFARLQVYAPQIRSERGVAFMLDVANQHGDGGAEAIFRHVQRPGLAEADLLAAVQQESVARVRTQFGEGDKAESTFNRREAFRTRTLLSEDAVAV